MSEECTINGCIFYIDRLNAFDQLEVMGDLQKDILPSIGGLFGALTSDNDAGEAEIADAISKLSNNLTGVQLKYWADRLLTKHTISVETEDGVRKLDDQTKQVVFDNFADILELLFYVLKVNFAGPLVSQLNRFGVDMSEIRSLDLSGDSAKEQKKSSASGE